MAVKPKPKPKRKPKKTYDQKVSRLLQSLGGLDPALAGRQNEKQRLESSSRFVSSHLDPVRRETESAIERRSQRGTGAISGYTREHEAQLEKIPGLVDADYTRQAADEAALQSGLRGVLEGGGRALQGELAGRLQQAGIEARPEQPGQMPPGAPPSADTGGINLQPSNTEAINAFLATKGGGPPPPMPPGPPPPSGGQFSGALGRFGEGAGGHVAADTYAASSRIGSEGASQRAYAHQLPGIAALGGRAATRDLQLQLNRELSDRMGEINAQAPGMAADEMERLRDREIQKAGGRQTALSTYLDRELQRQVAAASTGLDYAELEQEAREAQMNEQGRNQRASQAEQGRNARSRASNAAAAQRAAMTQQGVSQRQRDRLKSQGRVYDDAQSRSRGHLVDKKGRPITRKNPKTGKQEWIPYKPPKSGGGSNQYEK